MVCLKTIVHTTYIHDVGLFLTTSLTSWSLESIFSPSVTSNSFAFFLSVVTMKPLRQHDWLSPMVDSFLSQSQIIGMTMSRMSARVIQFLGNPGRKQARASVLEIVGSKISPTS